PGPGGDEGGASGPLEAHRRGPKGGGSADPMPCPPADAGGKAAEAAETGHGRPVPCRKTPRKGRRKGRRSGRMCPSRGAGASERKGSEGSLPPRRRIRVLTRTGGGF